MEKSKKHKKYSSSSEEEWVEREFSNEIKKTKVKSKKKSRYSSSDSDEIKKTKVKSKKKSRYSSFDSDEIKKTKVKSKKKSKYSSSDSDSSSSDEKYKKSKHSADSRRDTLKSDSTDKYKNEQDTSLQREEWMNMQTKFLTSSNSDRKSERDEQKRLDREKQQYDPRTCDRELNPFWKHGGDGLPTFKKPCDFDQQEVSSKDYKSNYRSKLPNSGSSSWRKKQDNEDNKHNSSRPSTSSSNWRKKEIKDPNSSSESCAVQQNKAVEEEVQFTEKDLNALAAKLVKAEIMGNQKQIEELKEKLEKARNSVKEKSVDDVLLTQTNHRGMSKPLQLQSEYRESNKSKNKKKRMDTHEDSQRMRYFADDDKYSLKQMFENEKYNLGSDQDKEFLRAYSKIKKNDDLDDIFSDKIREKQSDSKLDEKNRSKAIHDHQKVSKSLDTCDKCLQSELMLKHLMVSMGENVYLALPSFEPLTDGHCLIVPIRHVSCATQLDENEWLEILDVRKSLVKLFREINDDVIFFESAMNLNRFPHMVIECIPLPIEQGDLAPIYFKKAIDESEIEWAQNKKLVSLKGRDVRKAIPKGLPYFSVSFGMEEGFAHVIEDERLFPINFAQEIIGGMLDLHHSKWRKPKKQSFDDQSKRVIQFSKKWKDFDCFVTC